VRIADDHDELSMYGAGTLSGIDAADLGLFVRFSTIDVHGTAQGRPKN
jgi:hypothetical protein